MTLSTNRFLAVHPNYLCFNFPNKYTIYDSGNIHEIFIDWFEEIIYL